MSQRTAMTHVTVIGLGRIGAALARALLNGGRTQAPHLQHPTGGPHDPTNEIAEGLECHLLHGSDPRSLVAVTGQA